MDQVTAAILASSLPLAAAVAGYWAWRCAVEYRRSAEVKVTGIPVPAPAPKPVPSDVQAVDAQLRLEEMGTAEHTELLAAREILAEPERFTEEELKWARDMAR